MKILTEILDVMTDGFHKSGLEAQSKIFYILIHVLTQNLVIKYLIQTTNSISNDKGPN